MTDSAGGSTAHDSPALPLVLFGVTDDIVRRMVRDVRANVRTRLVKRADCEDAVLFALNQAARLNPCVKNLAAWLHVVACNKLRSRVKRVRVRERIEPMVWQHMERTTDHPGLSRLLRADETNALNEALSKLAPRWRTVIALHHLEGVPFAMIAEHLHITESTAKQMAYRARHKLRAILTTDPRIQ